MLVRSFTRTGKRLCPQVHAWLLHNTLQPSALVFYCLLVCLLLTVYLFIPSRTSVLHGLLSMPHSLSRSVDALWSADAVYRMPAFRERFFKQVQREFSVRQKARMQRVKDGVEEKEEERPMQLRPTRVCLFTADVPFTVTNGGTATAYYLLGKHLATMPGFTVKLVGLLTPPAAVRGDGQVRNAAGGAGSGSNSSSNVDDECSPAIRLALGAVGLQYDCLRAADLMQDGRELVSLHAWDRLALGAVSWLERNAGECELIHGHEWGGVLSALALQLRLAPARFPGVHLCVQSHGGHMWSQIGGSIRPSDMAALRIDDLERTTLEWADAVMSPSRYMLGYFTIRGWRLPVTRYVLPNIVEGAASSSSVTAAKAVWRLCFVGRLEERKGIKLFVQVVRQLSESRYWKKLDLRIPEVLIIGAQHIIDERPSDKWLQWYMKQHPWPFRTTILIGLNRTSALAYVQQPGILLVLPSLQENLPFVVAEAAMLGVPLLTFDVGGSREVLQLHAEDRLTYCSEVTADCLYSHVHAILARGMHYPPRLAPTMRQAARAWKEWHYAYQDVRRRFYLPGGSAVEEESEVADGRPPAVPKLRVVQLPVDEPVQMFQLYQQVCQDEVLLPGLVEDDADSERLVELVLLLPSQFELILSPAVQLALQHLYSGWVTSRSPSLLRVGALTFGVQLDNFTVSYGTAPTWQLYSQDGARCERHFPVLIRQHVFCQAFAVDVHVFPVYEPWILADVLSQQDMRLLSYPLTAFRYRSPHSLARLAQLPSCQPWAVPDGRYLNAATLDHLHRDVSEDLRDLYFPRFAGGRQSYPSLSSAMRTPENIESESSWAFRKGAIGQWKVGAVEPQSRAIYWYRWFRQQHRFGCHNSSEWAYPQAAANSVMHPCISDQNLCCGGAQRSSSLVRYTLSNEQAIRESALQFVLVYESNPSCGDGLKLTVQLSTSKKAKHEVLLVIDIRRPANRSGSAVVRESRSVLVRQFAAGDTLDFIIDPLETQWCDGLYLDVRPELLPTDRGS